MNNTKWRELCLAFYECAPKPAWRAKDLLNSYLSEWDKEWFYHVGPDYCSIEWLEIDPQGLEESQMKKILETVGVTYEETDGLFRVIGYKIRNEPPL